MLLTIVLLIRKRPLAVSTGRNISSRLTTSLVSSWTWALLSASGSGITQPDGDRHAPTGLVGVGLEGATVQSRVPRNVDERPVGQDRAIFDAFDRAGRDDGTPGVGLGLALSRGLARRLGGDLRLIGADHGASFALTLPASSAG